MKTATLAILVGSALIMNTPAFAADTGTPAKGGQEKQISIPEMIQHRIDKMNEHFKEMTAKAATKHTERITQLKEKLAKSKLSQAEQTEAVNFAETQYKKNVAYRTTQHEENVKFLEGLKTQTGLTKEQLKTMVQEHFAKQKEENKKHREDQQAARKAERQKLRDENKNDAKTAAPTVKA